MDTFFFVCDIQSRFRSIIHEYEHVVATTNKMLKIAKLLGFPVIVTTQNATALGPTDPDVDLASLGDLHLRTIDKTLFSMIVPEVRDILIAGSNDKNVVLMGIESHICILQTALELVKVAVPHINVYVIADAVSSCNPFEISLAFETMRHAGVKVISSESMGFLLMRDASLPSFREFSRIIRDSKDRTKAAGKALLTKSSM
ncbi:Isochorismatase-like protein [Rhodocollybia butyracea]|uniref:Isochorismatase-like protein n=1 Tax=Rhodocollybia butyracea TaxID=206335 RepID=A0A9P5Q8K0_9AGAR|nr:Isochorismatase-like protein [Rhodocollybia butyracea]